METQETEILYQRVEKLMTERFISIKDMAERLNMEYVTLWRKLNGKRSIDVSLLKRIAEILGTSAAYLLGETDDPSPKLFYAVKTAKSNPKPKKIQKKISRTTLELESMLKDIFYEYPDLATGFRDTRKQWGKMSQSRKKYIMNGLAELFIPKA